MWSALIRSMLVSNASSTQGDANTLTRPRIATSECTPLPTPTWHCVDWVYKYSFFLSVNFPHCNVSLSLHMQHPRKDICSIHTPTRGRRPSQIYRCSIHWSSPHDTLDKSLAFGCRDSSKPDSTPGRRSVLFTNQRFKHFPVWPISANAFEEGQTAGYWAPA